MILTRGLFTAAVTAALPLRGLFLAATVLVAPLTASAQNDNDINAGVQFDFASPGARSLGMGGAFVALADDATSVYTNPGGMTILKQPQINAQLSRWRWNSTLVNSGHVLGNASGIGVDTVTATVVWTFSGSGTGLSFFSFVYPVGSPVGRWRIGIFRHVLTRYNVERQQQGAFLTCVCYTTPQGGIERDLPTQQSIDVDVVGVGSSAAY